MKKIWKSLFVFIAVSPALASAVEVMNADLINKLKKGESASEVKQLLGEPSAEEKHADGQHVLVYEWLESKESSKHVWFTLLFNKQDKFTKLQGFYQTDTK